MLFEKEDCINFDSIHNNLQKGFGISHPEAIQGYNGYFGFSFGRIYIDDAIAKIIESNEPITEIIDDCLDKFRSFDYGSITKEEADLNFENRLFFGLNVGSIGRYIVSYGSIVIRVISSSQTIINPY